jgi:serine/threonine protein phosphatase PrpC
MIFSMLFLQFNFGNNIVTVVFDGVNTVDCSNIYSEMLSTSLLARASTVFP